MCQVEDDGQQASEEQWAECIPPDGSTEAGLTPRCWRRGLLLFFQPIVRRTLADGMYISCRYIYICAHAQSVIAAGFPAKRPASRNENDAQFFGVSDGVYSIQLCVKFDVADRSGGHFGRGWCQFQVHIEITVKCTKKNSENSCWNLLNPSKEVVVIKLLSKVRVHHEYKYLFNVVYSTIFSVTLVNSQLFAAQSISLHMQRSSCSWRFLSGSYFKSI